MDAHTPANTAQTSTQVAAPPLLGSPWRVAAAAVRGVSHERLDLPCQDAVGYLARPDGALLIAVADGAGSAQYSDQGANRAVEEALRALAGRLEVPANGNTPDEFWTDVLREAFDSARQAVFQLVDSQSEERLATRRDFACTLTCAISMGGRLAVGQVGDGAVVAVDGSGELFAVTRLQRGEYANETHFLVEEDALDQLVIEITDRPVSALAVMSDGLIRLALKMPAQEPHAPFFQPLFRFVETVEDEAEAARQLSRFLNSERVNARTDDDKSLVLAARIGPVEEAAATAAESAPPAQTGTTQDTSSASAGDEVILDREGE